MFICLLAGHEGIFLLFLRGNYCLHIFLLHLFFLNDRPQFEEEFSAEGSKQKNNEHISNDRRDEIIEETADGRPEEDVGDYYAHNIVVDKAGVFGGVASRDECYEVVEGCPQNQRVAEGGPCGLRVV